MLSRIGDRSDGSAAARVQGELKPGEVRATRGFSKRKSRQDHNFRHRAPANHKLVDFCQKAMRVGGIRRTTFDNKRGFNHADDLVLPSRKLSPASPPQHTLRSLSRTLQTLG